MDDAAQKAFCQGRFVEDGTSGGSDLHFLENWAWITWTIFFWGVQWLVIFVSKFVLTYRCLISICSLVIGKTSFCWVLQGSLVYRRRNSICYLVPSYNVLVWKGLQTVSATDEGCWFCNPANLPNFLLRTKRLTVNNFSFQGQGMPCEFVQNFAEFWNEMLTFFLFF